MILKAECLKKNLRGSKVQRKLALRNRGGCDAVRIGILFAYHVILSHAILSSGTPTASVKAFLTYG